MANTYAKGQVHWENFANYTESFKKLYGKARTKSSDVPEWTLWIDVYTSDADQGANISYKFGPLRTPIGQWTDVSVLLPTPFNAIQPNAKHRYSYDCQANTCADFGEYRRVGVDGGHWHHVSSGVL